MGNSAKNILKDRDAVAMAAWIVLQQLIAASSTLWIVWITKSVAAGSLSWIALGLFLASLTTPYLPAIMSMLAQEKWALAVQARLVEHFAEAFSGKTSLWADRSLREERISFLSGEGLGLVRETTFFFYDFLATLLNLLLNAVMIILVIDYKFGIAYLLGVGLSRLILTRTGKKIGELATSAQTRKVGFQKSVLNLWDNVVIGNRYNRTLWQAQKDLAFCDMRDASVGSVRYSLASANGSAFVSALPVLALLVILVQSHASDAAYLLALVATLPRQIQILNYAQVIIGYVSQANVYKARWAGVEKTLTAPESSDSLARIEWSDLTAAVGSQNVKPARAAEMPEHLRTFGSGRITLRGPNGAGKSTLLLYVKAHLGESAYYLPPQTDLVYDHDLANLSTGQKIRKILEEITDKCPASVVLLDEWDANLDEARQAEISALIDRLAGSACVVEIRNRTEAL